MNAKESLIDLLIHDLTGPISIVFTSVKNLLNKSEKYDTTEQQRAILERILRNSGKAKILLHDLVEVYRSEEGQFCKESFFIKEVIRESFLDALEILDSQKAEMFLCCNTSDEFFRTLQANGITVEISGKFNDTPFSHDHRKVQQIIRNLVSNALKYYRKQITLSISGETDLVISVEDDGPGMSEKLQQDTFKRFAGLKEKTNNDVKGLGFGLSCVKTLVEAMGGEITLKSRADAGTCFTLRIPPL